MTAALPSHLSNLRPVAARGSRWARSLTALLVRAHVRPNAVSGAAVLFGWLAAAALVTGALANTGDARWLYLGAAVALQLRLACNLLDGMVAEARGATDPTSGVWNDLPDRLTDALIFVAAGHSIPAYAWAAEIGWLAALLSVFTAYVRLLGGSLGLPQDFVGPMGKPHRMWVLTGACLAEALLSGGDVTGLPLLVALVLVVVGAAATAALRARRIVRGLRGGLEGATAIQARGGERAAH